MAQIRHIGWHVSIQLMSPASGNYKGNSTSFPYASLTPTSINVPSEWELGSRFVCTPEASSHQNFRMLSMKKVVPVRLLKNKFATTIQTAESAGATADELQL